MYFSILSPKPQPPFTACSISELDIITKTFLTPVFSCFFYFNVNSPSFLPLFSVPLVSPVLLMTSCTYPSWFHRHCFALVIYYPCISLSRLPFAISLSHLRMLYKTSISLAPPPLPPPPPPPLRSACHVI